LAFKALKTGEFQMIWKLYLLKITLLLSCLLLFSCQELNRSNDYDQIELINAEALVKEALYPDLLLGGCHYVDGEFKMMIQGISLGVRTAGGGDRKGAVLKRGAYLHLVLDDSLHLITHERNTPTKIPDGDYQISAFVARDFHESIKNPYSFMCRDIKVQNGQLVRSIKSSEARLVYGAPWGVFKNEDADYILLDFYLMNTTISPKGNKVKLSIDAKKEFIIDQWKSYYIKGLPEGIHELSLELINAEGKRIYGPVKKQISSVIEE
jgi:hypothetical protein